MRQIDQKYPWLKWLAAVVGCFLLVITASGCGGSSSKSSCPPPNTLLSSDLTAVQDSFEAEINRVAANIPLTKKQVAASEFVVYQVNDAVVEPGYIALEISVGPGYEGFGVFFTSKPSIYKAVYTRSCAGDQYELQSFEVAKSGVDLAKPKAA